jgi:hypothetical protein
MTKRMIAIGKRSGNRWVMREQESAAIQQVTRKGITRGLERVYGKVDKRSAKQ